MALQTELRTVGDCYTLSLDGALDFGECAGFRMMLDRILMAAPSATVVDLSRVQYLDSSGLGLLLSLSKELNANGAKLVLVTNSAVDEILNITQLSTVFSTAKSMEQADQIISPTTV